MLSKRHSHPIPFTELLSRAERMAIDGVPVYVCSIDDLVTLKQQAGRPQVDIEKLRRIQEKRIAWPTLTARRRRVGLYPATWEEVKDAELDDALRASPAQRLAWLEEAIKLAWMAGAGRDDKA